MDLQWGIYEYETNRKIQLFL